MPATGTAPSIAPPRQTVTVAVAGMARSYTKPAHRGPGRVGAAHRATDEMEPEYCEWMIDVADGGYVALYR